MTPGIAAITGWMWSRRRSYSAAISRTTSCEAVSASAAATWENVAGPWTEWELSAVQASASAFGPITQPTRQPVMQ